MIKEPPFSIKDAKAVAGELKNTFGKRAAGLDKASSFPHDNLELLKMNGFMNLLIPAAYGGSSFTVNQVSEIAKILAEGCVSTAMIWAMHCQQIAVLVNHGTPSFKKKYLPVICEGNHFVGSVTTEIGSGGNLLKSGSPLKYSGDDCWIDRMAPIVTGGAYCNSYLLTMKQSDNAADTDVVLVFALSDQLEIKTLSGWDTMGMRATNSCALHITGQVHRTNILNPTEEFKTIAIKTMVPYGHIAWASCWYGATRGMVQNIVRNVFRDRKKRKSYNLDSDLFLYKLAKIQLEIDTVGVYLNQTIEDYTSMYNNADSEGLFSPEFQLRINNLKILCSERTFNAANELIDLCGMKYGYLKNDEIALERLFRDLRSAALMYHNDRLYKVNGKLALMSLGKG